jgi:hypothetical protein
MDNRIRQNACVSLPLWLGIVLTPRAVRTRHRPRTTSFDWSRTLSPPSPRLTSSTSTSPPLPGSKSSLPRASCLLHFRLKTHPSILQICHPRQRPRPSNLQGEQPLSPPPSFPHCHAHRARPDSQLSQGTRDYRAVLHRRDGRRRPFCQDRPEREYRTGCAGRVWSQDQGFYRPRQYRPRGTSLSPSPP